MTREQRITEALYEFDRVMDSGTDAEFERLMSRTGRETGPGAVPLVKAILRDEGHDDLADDLSTEEVNRCLHRVAEMDRGTL